MTPLFKSDNGKVYGTEIEALRADVEFWKQKCVELQKIRKSRISDLIKEPEEFVNVG